jgi:LPS sulfotransferase NodH
LDEALGEHPDLRRGGELFGHSLSGNADHVIWRREALKRIYGSSQEEMIESDAWNECEYDLESYARAVFEDFNGFKFLYDQLHPSSRAITYFRSLEDVRVIFLRRNVVESLFSFDQAMKTGIWQRREGEEITEAERVSIPPKSFEVFLSAFDKEDLYREFFRDHHKIAFSYDDLIYDWDTTISAILRFIGVSQLPLPQRTLKRTKGRAKEMISNYDEIVNYFRDSPYSHHFRKVLF